MIRPIGAPIGALAVIGGLLLAACPERGASDSPAPERADQPDDNLASQRDARTVHESLHARPPTGAPDPDATITVGLQAEPAHLNPLLGADALATRIALGDIYEGLLCQDRVDARAEPCLASAVRASTDRRTWTFTIPAGTEWHDGTPFSAADVAFTYQLFTGVGAPGSARQEPALKTWLAGEFDDLQSVAIRTASGAVQGHATPEATIEATPEATTDVIMTFAGFRLGRREAFARVPILPRHRFAGLDPAAIVTAKDNRAPIGTGPYRLDSWTAGREIVLARFADHRAAPARAARVRYRIIASRQRMLRALVAGTIDIAARVPAAQAVALASENVDVRVFTETSPSYLAAVYNLRRPALGDARTRRALGLFMDRQSLIDAIFAGYADLISGPHLAGDPDRDPDIAPLPFDPAAARAQLAEVATRPATEPATEPVRATILVPSESHSMRRLADIWAEDAAPGAALDVELAPYAQVLGRLRTGDFDIALMAFTTGLDLDLFSRFHTGEPENYGGLSDPDLDRALAAVRAQPDPDARRTLQRAVQARIHALQPYTFIASGSQVGLVRAGIGGCASASAGSRGLWRASPGQPPEP